MDPDELVLFNLFEAGLWFVVAIVLLVVWKKQIARAVRVAAILPKSPRFDIPDRIRTWPLLAGAVVFVLFGISDLVETQTGAWWKPWWLLVWKVLCVHAMLTLCFLCRRNAPPKLPPKDGTDPKKSRI